jgi:hypothetical protein
VVENVADLLQNTSSEAQRPLNVSILAELFQKPVNVDSLLCTSSLYERARIVGDVPATRAEHQLGAKLHCLYGVAIQNPKRTRFKPVYPYAVSKVYDLRQYTDQTIWGPFLDDGGQHVDWEKVEAIMVVLALNIQLFSDRTNGIFEPIWTEPFVGVTPDSYVSAPPPAGEAPSLPLEFKDPFNVTGTWTRVSRPCFGSFGSH